jgi:hypothetical protein
MNHRLFNHPPKYSCFFLVLFIILSACIGSKPAAFPTRTQSITTVLPPLPTITVKPSNTSSPVPSLNPPTQSATLTFTPTVTLTVPVSTQITPASYLGRTATITSTSAKNAKPKKLSEVMLSRDDYLESDAGSIPSLYLQDVYDTFFKDGAATITNASTDIDPKCLIECTKQVWATKSYLTEGFGGSQVIVNAKVVIAMLRSKDEQGARITAYNLYKEFSPFEYEWGEDEYKLINAPIKNSRIGFAAASYDRDGVILTTSIGPITIWVVNFPEPLSDFAPPEVARAIYFANLQIRKLEKAGMVP